jgi:hypothetical protein
LVGLSIPKPCGWIRIPEVPNITMPLPAINPKVARVIIIERIIDITFRLFSVFFPNLK